MAAPSSRIPPFRSAEYWAALGTIADEFINETTRHAQRSPDDACGTLQKLSNRGFGHLSLFDLCALLVLAVPRAPCECPDAGARGAAILPATQPTPTTPPANAIAELKRGPVTVAAHPTERYVQHLRELEAGVAEALSISPEHPRARSTVRRALMARGNSIRDATAVYGIVCELMPRSLPATS